MVTSTNCRLGLSDAIVISNSDTVLNVMKRRPQDFSPYELFSNIMVLLIAGEDTTANTLAWVIYYLVDQPEIQDEIYKEITSSDIGLENIDYLELDSFPLTFAVCQEAIRLKPVTPFSGGQNLKTESIHGYEIPPNTLIFSLLSKNASNPKLFESPEIFVPKRWLSMDKNKSKEINKKLMPFGGGPRVCPGRLLSYQELKTGLIIMLSKFKFVKDENYSKGDDRFNVTVGPEGFSAYVIKR